MKRALNEPIRRDLRHGDPFYPITGTEGIDLMIKDLIRQLHEQWERELVWY